MLPTNRSNPLKIKVSLLVTAVGILKTIDLTKMKLSTSYKVRQVLSNSELAIQDFESRRKSLAEEHGSLNKAGTHYEWENEEDKESFQKGMTELMNDEIDIDIKPIPYELLDNYINIEPGNIPFVEWFISGLE